MKHSISWSTVYLEAQYIMKHSISWSTVLWMSNLEEYKMFQLLYEPVFIGGSKYMPSMLPSVCQLAQSTMQWLKYGLDNQRITPWFLGGGGGGAGYFHSHSVQTKSTTQLVYNTLETFAIFLLVMHPKHNANYLHHCARSEAFSSVAEGSSLVGCYTVSSGFWFLVFWRFIFRVKKTKMKTFGNTRYYSPSPMV